VPRAAGRSHVLFLGVPAGPGLDPGRQAAHRIVNIPTIQSTGQNRKPDSGSFHPRWSGIAISFV